MECYTVIFDSFKWLPHYGENSIVIHPRKKGCIIIDIICKDVELTDEIFLKTEEGE
ncbi:hypothetical protein [Sulfurospirillum multivorans]|uniref:hypothetical protein n=1 Tax=Sulfurospirillum multivorans TaxID=66821 RepID=UPI0004B63770|nr:hypothetical protein [Sulfurospirillum multivorans]